MAETLENLLEYKSKRYRSLMKRIARKVLTIPLALSMMVPAPGTQIRTLEMVGNINQMSRVERKEVIEDTINIIKKYENRELTPLMIGPDPIRFNRSDPQEIYDPDNVSISDLYSFLSQGPELRGVYSSERTMRFWNHSTKISREYEEGEILDEIFWEVIKTANKIYLKNPDAGFENIILKAFNNTDVRSKVPMHWRDYDFTKLFGLPLGNRLEMSQPGDYNAFMILNIEESLKYFKEFGLDFELIGNNFLIPKNFQDIRVDALRMAHNILIKKPEVLDELRVAAKNNDVPLDLLNILVSSRSSEVPVQTPLFQRVILSYLPTIKEEDDHEDDNIRGIVARILKEQDSLFSSGRIMVGQRDYVLPSDILWHPKLVELYKSIRSNDTKYIEAVLSKQSEALSMLLEDDAFFSLLPNELSFMGVGCSEDPSELLILDQLLKRNRRVKKFIFADIDRTSFPVYLEAIRHLEQKYNTTINIEGLQAKITGDNLKSIMSNEPAPMIVSCEGIINFDGFYNKESSFFNGLVNALREGDYLLVAKPINKDDAGIYERSCRDAFPIIAEVTGLDQNCWEYEGVSFEDGYFKAYARCVSQDNIFYTGDRISFLHSSRKSIRELLEDTISTGVASELYYPSHLREVGYEFALLRKS